MKITDLYEESKFLTDKSKIIAYMYESFSNFQPNSLIIQSGELIYSGVLHLRNHVDELKVQFKSITNSFYCDKSMLTTLEGFPSQVYGDLSINNNPNLNELKYFPKNIVGDVWVRGNSIKDPYEYRHVLYCVIDGRFIPDRFDVSEIINTDKNDKSKIPYKINKLKELRKIWS